MKNIKTIDKIGKKYGKLLILSVSHQIKDRVYVNTLCDCGTEKVIALNNICRKEYCTKSCGCVLFGYKRSEPSYVAEYNRWHKQSVVMRDIECSLTCDDWINLITKNCYYCGAEPNQIMHNSMAFKKNGIDRLDSNIGYHIENCVTCCSDCNYCKNTTPHDEFLQLIGRIYLYQQKKSS